LLPLPPSAPLEDAMSNANAFNGREPREGPEV